MKTNPYIFREYDIRGLAEEELTSEVAGAVGKAFGTFLGGSVRVAVGRDVRLSSPRLNSDFSEGLLASGCDVVELGEVPTPVSSWTTLCQKTRKSCSIRATGYHQTSETAL